ncbi:MAG: DUF805 domain-containing protein [Hyphomicrobium sp.]
MSHFGLITELLDPRGPCNRQGLLAAAGALLAMQCASIGLSWMGLMVRDSAPAMVLGAVFLWSAIAVTAKRLHDAGLSAWWIGKALLAVMVSTAVLPVVMMSVLPRAAF